MALLQKAYLGATPLFREQSWFEGMNFFPVEADLFAQLQAGSVAHTKGAWVELTPSTIADASCLLINVQGISFNNTNTSALIDIATGPAGAESVLMNNIAVGGASSIGARPGIGFTVPIKIPSGTRLSARMQSVRTGGVFGSLYISLYDMNDYSYAPTVVDVLGTSTITSRGTTVGTGGGYVQVVASTSNSYRAIVLVPSIGGTLGISGSNYYEVAIGNAGSESVIGQISTIVLSSEEIFFSPLTYQIITANIPAGSRIAVSSTIGTSPPVIDVTLIGII
jgi:hypothetical protein